MHKYLDQYLPAPASRIEDAERIFPYKEIGAEEYAAREGHRWASFSFGEYIYPDEKLNEWIHTLDESTVGEVQEVVTFYTAWDIGRSNTRPLKQNDVVVGSVFEPRSETRNYGIQLKAGFTF